MRYVIYIQLTFDHTQGGHYMRPDLIRLLVDTNRKDLVVHEDRQNGGVVYTKTVDRVGLSSPLHVVSTPAASEEN